MKYYLIALCLLVSISCQKENLQSEFNEELPLEQRDIALYTLNVKKFATNIENALSGNTPGFAYCIYYNNQVYYNGIGGKGFARRPLDIPSRLHGAQQRQALASTTKFSTAILVAKILEKNGKTLEEKIYKYLPSDWTPHPNFKLISFRQLLAHKSGLIPWGNKYDEMKKMVEEGINLPEYNSQIVDYENINYFMCHYLVPYMVGRLEDPYLLFFLEDNEDDHNFLNYWIAYYYRYFLRLYVFKPAGLQYWDKVDFRAWDNNGPIDNSKGTKFYKTFSLTEQGSDVINRVLESGPGGLYISAAEYAKTINATARGKIISPALYSLMKRELCGFDRALSGKFGPYYYKDGWGRGSELLFDFGPAQVQIVNNCECFRLDQIPGTIVTAYDDAIN